MPVDRLVSAPPRRGTSIDGTVRTDGPAILAAARRHLASEAQTRHTVAADLADALNRAECSHLLADR